MPSARLAAIVFCLASLVVALFQLALALGAPWGEFAMGGAVRGAYPPAMRAVALAQILIYGALAAIVLARADVALPRWRRASGVLIWAVVAILAIGVVLNLITPSPRERLVWTPVALLLALSALRVALSGPRPSPKGD